MGRITVPGGWKLHRGGFSLVEVLASVAIVALASTAVMAGIRSGARLNNRAYNVAEGTAYLQQAMEEIKGMDMESLLALYHAEGPRGVVETKRKEEMTEGLSKEEKDLYSEDCFTVYTLTKENWDFRVTTVLDPIPYSVIGQDESIQAVTDANTYGTPDVNQIDALKNPLISNQIDMYDEAAAEELWFLLPATVRKLEPLVLDDKPDSEQTNIIRNNIKKNTKILLTGNSSRVMVECSVTYESEYTEGGVTYPLQKDYTVYQSSFELVPNTYIVEEKECLRNWKKGGNIYIFATADGGFRENNITIDSQSYSGEYPLFVSFIRNAYQAEGVYGYNFDSIILKGVKDDKMVTSPYFDLSSTATEIPSGYESFDNMRFFSNVRYTSSETIHRDLALDSKKPEEKPVYNTNKRVRCYAVTSTLYTQDGSDTVQGVMTSVKEVQ